MLFILQSISRKQHKTSNWKVSVRHKLSPLHMHSNSLRPDLASGRTCKTSLENMFSVPRPTATARYRQDAQVQTGQLGLTLTHTTEAICRDPAVILRRPKTAVKHSGSSNSKKHPEYLRENNRLLVAHRTRGHC